MEAVREREHCDRGLLAVTLILLLLGTAIVLDASYARALQSKAFNYDAYYFFKRQVIWACLSVGAMMVGMSIPYWKMRRFWAIGVVAAIVLLIAVMVPGIGREVNGSRRWLGVGPLTLQPSELAKIALILFLARYSELWRSRIRNLVKGFIPAVAVVFVIGGLIAKEDLGTAISTISTGLIMICLMGARPQHIAGLIGACLLAGVGLVLVEPYRMERIWAWLTLVGQPVAVHDGPAYQPAQGLIALGSGGISGQGIMQGRIKHLYLPAEHTDYIFATVGEETGLIGCVVLLGLFAWLIIRGLTIAHRTRDWFGSLVAAGFTAQIGCQALLNIGVVTGIFPCTGVPLPFISYGGSSLLFTTLAVGIILNVSRHPDRPIMESKVRRVRESRADGWRNRRPHLSRT
jgi:cell division protein FtsW